MPPFSHINGKIAPASKKCTFQASGDSNGVEYAYGYKYRTKNESKFAIRSKCRNLSNNPITTREQANFDLFKQSVQACAAHWNSYSPELVKDFNNSPKKYSSLWTYACAAVYKAGGVWLW